ncbi:MAG: hypothetical protein OXI65_10655 [Acidobacteriota bacterium]|nr:hypothetical protein [Acidobacteriota bacterium]
MTETLTTALVLATFTLAYYSYRQWQTLKPYYRVSAKVIHSDVMGVYELEIANLSNEYITALVFKGQQQNPHIIEILQRGTNGPVYDESISVQIPHMRSGEVSRTMYAVSGSLREVLKKNLVEEFGLYYSASYKDKSGKTHDDDGTAIFPPNLLELELPIAKIADSLEGVAKNLGPQGLGKSVTAILAKVSRIEDQFIHYIPTGNVKEDQKVTTGD